MNVERRTWDVRRKDKSVIARRHCFHPGRRSNLGPRLLRRRFAPPRNDSIIAILGLLLIMSAGVACAESPQEVFYKANGLYGEGKYAEAIEQYGKILASGYESGNVYYNLGNACFKSGRLGKAILYYEKAIRLMPRDSDLESNLRYALTLTENNIHTPSMKWYERLAGAVFGQFTINETAMILSAAYIFMLAALAIWLYAGRKSAAGIALAVLAAVVSLAWVSLSAKAGLIGRESVVITKSVEARFEPFDRATTHFTIYEGSRVKALIYKSDWTKIERPDGKAGWVKSEALETI